MSEKHLHAHLAGHRWQLNPSWLIYVTWWCLKSGYELHRGSPLPYRPLFIWFSPLPLPAGWQSFLTGCYVCELWKKPLKTPPPDFLWDVEGVALCIPNSPFWLPDYPAICNNSGCPSRKSSRGSLPCPPLIWSDSWSRVHCAVYNRALPIEGTQYIGFCQLLPFLSLQARLQMYNRPNI